MGTRGSLQHIHPRPRPDDNVALSAHELKNIAASVYGCALTLLEHASSLPLEKQQRLLQIILDQSTRLEHLTEAP